MSNNKGQSGSTHKTVAADESSDFKVKLGSGEEVAPPAKQVDTEAGRKALTTETALSAPKGARAYVIKYQWYDKQGVLHPAGSTVYLQGDEKPSRTWVEVPVDTARTFTTLVSATSDAGGKRVADESPI